MTPCPPPIRALALGGTLLPALLTAALAQAASQPLRFVVIPKLSHPWFDTVRGGAQEAASMIQRQTGSAVLIDYRPPAKAEVALQEQARRQGSGNDFCQLAERLVTLLGGQGEVAALPGLLGRDQPLAGGAGCSTDRANRHRHRRPGPVRIQALSDPELTASAALRK